MGDGSYFRNQMSPFGGGRPGIRGVPLEGGSFPRYASRERVRQQEADRAEMRDLRAEQQARERFITLVERASARHPEIDQQVFRDVIAAYEAERESYVQAQKQARRDAPNAGYLRSDLSQARSRTLENIRGRIAHHGAAGREALHAIAQENQPESAFTPVARMLYNTDRGGLQIGGLGGAAALGGLAYFMASSSGAGGLLTWVLTAGAALLGAYAGSSAFPGADTLNAPNFRSPAPARGPAPAQQITPPAQQITPPAQQVTPPAQQVTPLSPGLQAGLGPLPRLPEGVRAAPESLPGAPTAMPEAQATAAIRPAPLTGRESAAFTPEAAPAPGPDTAPNSAPAI